MVAEVIVVGAGPAGVSAGEQIAKAGYEVLVLEKNCSRRKKSLGGALSKKHFTDLKLPKEIIEKECYDLVYHLQEEKLNVLNRSGFVLFDRATLDRFLIQKAEESGVRLLDSTLVSDVAKREDGLAIHYKRLPTGKLEEGRTRLVVFADGTSTLAQKFQIGFGGEPDGTALGAAYDLEYSKNALRSMDFFFSDEISPFGYGWIFPRKNTVNVGVICLLSKMKHDIQTYLDSFVSSTAMRSREILGYTSRLMPQSVAEKLHSDSILVVGDAAGTADPIDGGGIFNAIVSGQAAGRVAVEALEAGNTTASFLSKYEDTWKKTENYMLFHQSYLLQRLALKADVSLGVFLERMGIFERHGVIK